MTPKNVTSTQEEKNRVKDTDIAHLAGVFDAIGNVRLSVVKNNNYKINYTLRPSVLLLRPDREDPLLGKLMQYSEDFGAKYSIIEQTHGRDDGMSLQWTVKGTEDVRLVLEPMMDYLVTKFYPAQLMLDQIIPALEDDKHLNKQGFYEIMGLNDELRKYKSNYGNVKYTQEYFADEWEDDLTVVE
jgi:hypothetical protein